MDVADLARFAWSAVSVHLDVFGSLGLCLGFSAGMMKQRSWMLLASAACSSCFGLHYLHLGAGTGMAMCSISVLQSLVSARFIGDGGRPAWVAPLFAATSLLAACLTLATWSGWASACAGLGSLLATAARLQAEPRRMRRFFLGASTCWAGHNLLVGSVFGLTCDLLTVSGLLIAIMRTGEARSAVPA
ncbi:YgjV family protein [Methylobacterium durans]|uniref:YgjV family protein n=1 Tax=Methylobacterium durans TaxID=2202825 RepID=A0A2U8WD85_9HYPH|nr:hypothetical protein DK389_31135 [Methylobacterium durans]